MNLTLNNHKAPAYLLLLIIVHALLAITPILNSLPILIYLDLVIVVLWVFLFINRYNNVFQSNRLLVKIFVSVNIIIFIALLYYLVGLSTAKIGKCIRYWSFFATILMGWFSIRCTSFKQQKWLFYSIILIVMVSVVDNIRLTFGMSPEEIELLMEEQHEILTGSNFGGTSFTCVAFILNMLTFMSFMIIKGKKKILFLVLFLVSMYYTIYCGMRGTTAILLLIFLVASIYYGSIDSGKAYGKIISAIVLLLLIVAVIDSDAFFSLLVSVLPSDRLAKRFMDAQMVANEGITDSSFTGRMRLYEISLNSWTNSIASFIFGIGELAYGKGFNKYIDAGISGHSDIIDLLAKFGILGFSLFSYVFYNIYKLLKKMFYGYNFYNQIVVIFVIFIIYGVFKTIFSTDISVLIFVLFPLCCSYLASFQHASKSGFVTIRR